MTNTDCDAEEVVGLFPEIIKPTGYKFIQMRNIKEVGYNAKTQLRLCQGLLSTTAGAEDVEYHIRWQNREESVFYVEFVQ